MKVQVTHLVSYFLYLPITSILSLSTYYSCGHEVIEFDSRTTTFKFLGAKLSLLIKTESQGRRERFRIRGSVFRYLPRSPCYEPSRALRLHLQTSIRDRGFMDTTRAVVKVK
jgi:hypothetical protein